MKKLLLAFALILGSMTALSAKDKYAHDASVLPESARSTIASNFKAAVSLVKIDKGIGGIHEYEVILTDGTEISFDKNGNWDNVETSRHTSVPGGFIPAGVKDYVARQHAGTKIVGIDKERNGYEVELSNGIDMKFDKSGKFIRYDD